MWGRSQGLDRTVIEDVALAEDGSVVISVRPRAGERERCGKCHERCAYRDGGDGRRRWRGLDCGVVRVYVEADAPRVGCPEHGVIVAAVPWARHDTWFTRMFDDLVAWKVVDQSAKAVCEELGIAWRTVGRICKRVCAERRAMLDPFADLREIGFDEISVRRGQRYMTVVVDHRSGRLVWAGAGRDRATVERFLDLLGPEGCEKLELGVPRTQQEGRCRRSVLSDAVTASEMEGLARLGLVVLRGRPAGGGCKPPQGAAVKSRGVERCGEGAPLSASGVG